MRASKPALPLLIAAVDQLIANRPSGPVHIGFSGGLDSSVLLACAARSEKVRARGLRAVHVHHGLHADADLWAVRAQATADSLGVPMTLMRVQVDQRGQGLEAAARNARYAAFSECVSSGWLLLAHHQEDQAETVLLRLLRGAALDGVAAMRMLRSFSDAWLGRPWLNQPRERLRECAGTLGLEWSEDPSNRDPRHDRAFLRNMIWPLLEQRFPAVATRLLRFAEHAQGVQRELDGITETQLVGLRHAERASLSVTGLLALSETLFGLAVRRFAIELGAPVPGFHELALLRREVLEAAADANPCLRFRRFEFRRYRDELYLLPEAATRPAPDLEIIWNVGAVRCALPEGFGALEALNEQADPSPIPHAVTVRFRHSGDRIRPAGSVHTRELRLLFQERGVPTWERARMPLLFQGKQMLAAVGLESSAELATLWPGLRVRWRRA